MNSNLSITFLTTGRMPEFAPDPAFPEGRTIDGRQGGEPSCSVSLPYPAPCCGFMQVTCETCKQRLTISVAGRIDDPHTVRLPCRTKR
jgi:hypothetical protein